jgi:phenylpropionate dioxygenase-like ring-hydroxylating dioxygenase large terminal subunit
MTVTQDLLSYLAPRGRGGEFYQRVLDTDSRQVPGLLRRTGPFGDEATEVPVSAYLTRDSHHLEVDKVWKRTWQMACREDQIAEVGDTLVYDIADMSFIIARVTPTVIRAYPNACLHRGRKLVDGGMRCATRLRQFRCAFHGFTWDLEGSLASVPASWDFPHVNFEEWELPQVKVGTWAGFVFINPDPDAGPLEDFLGDIDEHFADYDYANRWTAAHVVKVVPTNWKAAQEAFMESFHVLATHPQLLPQSSNLDAQYDAWGNYSRAMSPNFLPSGFLNWLPTEQEIVDASVDRRLDAEQKVVVPDGTTARLVMADQARASLTKVLGADRSDRLSDAEVSDSFYFTLFPNLHPWSAYNRICFRFRPYGNDPDRAIQDVYLLSPYSGERPPAVATHYLREDEDFTAGHEIGPYLARILNQDLYNMPNVQQGMKATRKPTVTFSHYQELKIRHFHKLLDEAIARP